ncbi:hypothetical protein K503DRAFT_773777 [Rhizopogon vinicolor AM-OR11-026]|uniref:Uncharacterized protein n=1 Tax=Rhizopogon vinicolor AM-OR11-026 TaxID=1314800 RepID=A0A1B7MRC7_9AGAM|nr:hypothetical protein K503DRAFT_773777 [Rhizopogon vinicolor AM-OR11-026]
MRFTLISAVLLAQAFTALSQDLSCEDRAKQAGLPTDGWKVVYDDAGQLKCRRGDNQEFCHGVEYMDADTKAEGCCEYSGLTWFDMPDGKFARCCAKDHVWTYDKGDGPSHGGCCYNGSMMHNGQCVPSPGPAPCHSEL